MAMIRWDHWYTQLHNKKNSCNHIVIWPVWYYISDGSVLCISGVVYISKKKHSALMKSSYRLNTWYVGCPRNDLWLIQEITINTQCVILRITTHVYNNTCPYICTITHALMYIHTIIIVITLYSFSLKNCNYCVCNLYCQGLQ